MVPKMAHNCRHDLDFYLAILTTLEHFSCFKFIIYSDHFSRALTLFLRFLWFLQFRNQFGAIFLTFFGVLMFFCFFLLFGPFLTFSGELENLSISTILSNFWHHVSRLRVISTFSCTFWCHILVFLTSVTSWGIYLRFRSIFGICSTIFGVLWLFKSLKDLKWILDNFWHHFSRFKVHLDQFFRVLHRVWRRYFGSFLVLLIHFIRFVSISNFLSHFEV